MGVVVASTVSGGLTGDAVGAEEQAAITSVIAATTAMSKRDILIFTVNIPFSS